MRRFYRGGELIGRLRGKREEDAYFPEDWLGSTTNASNADKDARREGLSRLDDGRLLCDAIAEDPIGWLGQAHTESFGMSTALLVKLLDSAERLPVHGHPSDAFAAAILGSRFGKTEAWIVLATREQNGEVWVGLRESIAASTYRGWIERQDTDSLLSSLNRFTVSANDIVYVPAGLPHAIGAGILIAELQQPTDFSIVCEWEGFPIRPADAHLGVGWDLAIQALDLSVHTPIRGLPEEARAFFWADERAEPAGRFAVLVILEGKGKVDGMSARAGDAFAVPASAHRLDVEGDLRVLRCLAPDPT